MRHSEQGLFRALEEILRESGKPMDCVQLFDFPTVKEYAASPNRVSDYLGGLWRKGLVVRLPAGGTEGSRARWMYQWKTEKDDAAGVPYAPKLLVDRPEITVLEEGLTMIIQTQHLSIRIQQKKK